MKQNSSTGMWWLARRGEPTGPHSFQAVAQALSAGRVSSKTLACPVQGQEWKPLTHWPEFADVRQVPSNMPLLTNPNLPPLANWICLYSFVFSPVSFLLNWFLTGLSGPTFVESSRIHGLELWLLFVSAGSSLILMGAGILGAVRLKRLIHSGEDIILASFWGGMLFGVVQLVLWFLLFVVADPADFVESSESLSGRELFLLLFQLAWGILEFAFLVVAMVWLHRSRASRLASMNP
ncbi:MAG TPA: DUF4339 domain-containing protein [Planctomicrobium sp.]|nr:DUF4339 domain-containing protein [Planctomicrobium sp.]